ncbi:MAG: nuclear transport factor 2 family protein [Nitrospirae bacterium]|nr:nuclear transport factor 2 family protein [Nitrospirota bacterium]
MSAMEIGKEIVALCQQGKNLEAIEKFYSQDIVSVEAFSMPGMDQTQKGIEAIKGKNKWWTDNHEVHGAEIRGPFPNGDRFALFLKYDVTPKHTGQRMTMEEVALYTVKNGKVTKEEFFFAMPECS